MRKAWIAISLAPVLAAIGCQEDPAPVTQVPPPVTYDDSGIGAYDPVVVAPAPGMQGQNTHGQVQPAPAPVPVTGIPQVAQGQTYTIQENDTLWAIASRVYGDGQRWVDIAQANPSLDPTRMSVGKVITLP